MITTTVIDLLVQIPLLTPVLESFHSNHQPLDTGDDGDGDDDDKENNMLKTVMLNTVFETLCRSFKDIILLAHASNSLGSVTILERNNLMFRVSTNSPSIFRD